MKLLDYRTFPFEGLQPAILAGSIFLVNQFVPGTLRFVLRGWPLILIGIGVYNLSRHFRTQPS